MIAKFRPSADIIVISNDERTINEMSVLWGIQTIHIELENYLEESKIKSIKIAIEKNLIEEEITHILVFSSSNLSHDIGCEMNIYDLSKFKIKE
jgi:pyruvate kinase